MKILKTALFLMIAAALLGVPRMGQSVGPFTNFAILIDQSGEMNEVHQQQSKNFIAREVAERLLNNLPSNMKGAIYMYGIMAANNENRVLKVQRWQQFDKDSYILALDKVDKQTGPSVLSVALRTLTQDMQDDGITGWTAVFIISGGNETDVEGAEERAKELKQSHPDLCIYTILVGNSSRGGDRLSEVKDKGKCGMQVNADSINNGTDMARYVRVILNNGSGGDAADSDNDQVPDAQDQCPGTPFGAGVDARGCWVLNDINFRSGKWNIESRYYNKLNKIAGVMNANPKLNITVEGHTDSNGDNNSNLNLSQKRAQAVLDYLVRAAVDQRRLTASGKGEDYPIGDNSTSQGKAMNRRIEFVIQ